jgi:predicted GH43/DUF377 family glycosyl hydrolase
MKSRYSDLFTKRFTLILTAINLLFSTCILSQNWYDPDWHYRNAVIVTNTAGSVLTDYQVRITLDDSFDFTKAESDGNDIRITDTDGLTLIPFWLESWDNVLLQASIWMKVPLIPMGGTTLYLYYGNPDASTTPPEPVEVPPAGPFARAAGNPITPTGATGTSLLAENIVFDPVTNHYWLCLANYSQAAISLCYSDNPTDPGSWIWSGNVVTSFTQFFSGAPHLLKHEDTWYLFYTDRPHIMVATASNVAGPYTINPIPVLSPSGPSAWDTFRVDEPYIFHRDSDNKWVMIYMGDAGGTTEQVGYATADNVTGPYTPFAGNPCIAFGPPGSFDAGTIADPWVYEFQGMYYIGYTVSSTKYSPWQTALATTSDWLTFTKQGVILPASGTPLDTQNSFRGAVTRIGDTYVFSYTSGGYRMSIATQPVFMQPENIINNPEAVFNFYDGFEGSGLNLNKWAITKQMAQTGTATVSDGILTLRANSNPSNDIITLTGNTTFGPGYLMESSARHSDANGSGTTAAELGLGNALRTDLMRIFDYNSALKFIKNTTANNIGGSNYSNLMSRNLTNSDFLLHRIYWKNSSEADFGFENDALEPITTNIPSISLPPWLMCAALPNQATLLVDWFRVRKWIGSDPVTYIVYENTPLAAIEAHTPILCYGGLSTVTIFAIGGTPPYAGTGIFSQSAGTVIYTVTDALGDTTDIILSISEPTVLMPSLNSTEIICHGGTSAVTISVTGGTPPYTGTGVFSHTAGTYMHTITDANGCDTTVSFTLTEPPALIVTAEFEEIPYPGGTSTVTISASGGTPPYSGTGTFLQGPGTFIYTVTDANGCMLNYPVTLTDPSEWLGLKWKYRRSVFIENPAGTELTNFQVRISLDETFDFNKAQADGSDIRFTDIDKTSIIPFWIETWNPTEHNAEIWVKVASIPLTGTTIYLYYGNPNPTADIPNPVEVPPTGPFTRAAGNPVVPIGATGTSLLAENIVFDEVTNHYWMCLANYSQSCISLCYSDNPTDPNAWVWSGNVITTFSQFYSGAPHLLKYNGTWYLFYADRPNIKVATASNVAGPYTINPTPVLSPSGPSPAWDNFRVDEPYVFFRESDSKWVIVYMGDSGGAHEQIGYAYADNITGPYTTFTGNPCLPFGAAGTFDAGTVADPWVYEFNGVYYIGYTVSPTTSSPWQTAIATTADWQTFTKQGIIFPLASSGWDSNNCFRGAVTQVGDTYLFSYTGDSYKMGIATQPVFMDPSNYINNPEEVFDFFDGFDTTSLDLTKWSITHGNINQTSFNDGLVTLFSPSESGYLKISGLKSFGMNYISETKGYHPDQGTQNKIAEAGLADVSWNTVRIVDDFILGTTYWQRQSKIAGGSDLFDNMAQIADQSWHVFRVSRMAPNIAGFQIDYQPIETVNTNVPTINLPPFLMSYGPDNNFIVDWTRIRKWLGTDPVVILGEEYRMEILNLKVYLEGPFNGTNMNTNLNSMGLLPLIQPYNVDPWNYSGSESVDSIPGSDLVDWVLVEIRDAQDGASASSSTRVAQQAAFLLKNGNIVGLDGNSMLMFNCPINQQLFAVIWHRNHLGLLSANPLLQNDEGIYTLDFTINASQAFGEGQNDLGNNSFGMIGGDINSDGNINDLDHTDTWGSESGKAGYLKGDISLDGQVNNQDKNDFWNKNFDKFSFIPE